MPKILDILTYLEEYAPYNLSEHWDNCGLMVGDTSNEVTNILCSLDVTPNVILEAINCNCNLIISHHPLIFTSIKCVSNEDYIGKMIIMSIKNDISIICMHTNLDCANDGVNDALANALGLLDIKNLEGGECARLGRFGHLLNEICLDKFLDFTKNKLQSNGIKFTGNRPVKKVAVLGGSGGKLIDLAINNDCDTYVTADCSYDTFQKAEYMNINLIDAGHFATENVICDVLKNKIEQKFNNTVKISSSHRDIINFR